MQEAEKLLSNVTSDESGAEMTSVTKRNLKAVMSHNHELSKQATIKQKSLITANKVEVPVLSLKQQKKAQK